MTSSMPTAAATARAVASLSPVSSTGCSPSPRSRATARAADGLIVSATAMAPRTSPSHPASTAVQPASSQARHRAAKLAGAVMPCPGNSVSRPTMTAWPSTVPRAPSPGSALKSLASGSGPVSLRAAALIAAATACSDACSTAPAYLSTSVRLPPPDGRTPASDIRPVVTVPVLSSTTTRTDRDDSRAW